MRVASGWYLLDLGQLRIADAGVAVLLLVGRSARRGPWRLEASDGRGLRLQGGLYQSLDTAYQALRDLERRSPILLRDLQAALAGGAL